MQTKVLLYKGKSVLEEDENRCRAGVDKFGIVYDKKWCGLYMPENKFKIVDIHFHTPESVTIPSLQDIKSLYIMLARNSVKNYEKFTGGIGCARRYGDIILNSELYERLLN